jgi:hypothetical protein
MLCQTVEYILFIPFSIVILSDNNKLNEIAINTNIRSRDIYINSYLLRTATVV